MERNGILIPSLEGAYKERSYQQKLARPFKVIQNLPIAKGDIDYSALKNPLSIKDSAVLYNSLYVSRFNWLHHVFRVYWSKREQAIVGDKDTQKKDKTVRFCDADFDVGVHKFAIKLFFLKDDLKEKQFVEEQERKREERIQRRKAKEEEKLKTKQERERLEKEKEALKEKLRIEYDSQMNVAANPNSNIPTGGPFNNTTISAGNITNGLPNNGTSNANISDTNGPLPVTNELNVSETSKIQTVTTENNSFKLANIPSNAAPEGNNKMPITHANITQESTKQETLKSFGKAPIDAEKQSIILSQTDANIPTESTNGLNSIDVKEKTTSTLVNEKSSPPSAETVQSGSTTLAECSETKKELKPTSSRVPDNKETISEQQKHPPPPPPARTLKLISDPKNALLIQNLNLMARTDAHLNEVMKEVASGAAPAEKILEFKTYIEKAKKLGDPTGYMRKLELAKKLNPQNSLSEADIQKTAEENEQKIKARERAREKAREKARQKKLEISKDGEIKPRILTFEERKKLEEEQERQAQLVKEQLEKMRLEKQRLREEREAEKLRLKLEKAEKRAKEKEQRELEKQRLREEKAKEKERKKEERLAEKERAKLARERRKESVAELDDSDSEDENDRMAKLNNEEYSDDLWNDKLSPLQERYSKNATLVLEFVENPVQRFLLPRDTIYEVIENEEDENVITDNENTKAIEETSGSPAELKTEIAGRPKSPYVTILASFVLVHNQAEIDGWERRKKEAEEAEANKLKKEHEEAETKRRKRKKSGWSSNQATKRATRASKQAKAMETLRREEENFHEEDEELNQNDGSCPKPVYSCMTVTFSKVPYRFADFIVNSGNDLETCQTNMKEILSTGTRVPPSKLWYQLDGFKDELLAETLRYNLNRLDYANSSGKRTKHQFIKKFGRGGG